MNSPREGKRLLVLDVDYTLFGERPHPPPPPYREARSLCLNAPFVFGVDHKSCAESGQELMRPYLHEFLTSAYADYDIVIWCTYKLFVTAPSVRCRRINGVCSPLQPPPA